MVRRKPGIFSIEGRWSASLEDKRSVRPLLEVAAAVGNIQFLHVPVLTRESFERVVQMWSQRQYSKYSIGYFAFHGSSGRIRIGRASVTLQELGEMLHGACNGRLLYFGACSTLDVPDAEIAEFRKVTGARAVLGYTTDVDWFESAAFDLLLLDAATHYERPDALENWLRKHHGQMCDRLGFKVYYAKSVDRRPVRA